MTPVHRHRIVFLAIASLPMLLGAKGDGCGGDDLPIGGDSGGNGGDGGSPTCEVADCGPPLGMPNYECPDGTIAGPTGACLQTPDGCGWQVLECPPSSETCTPDECGPAPGMPNYLCDDGSVAGPTGECQENEDGTCGWEIRECPPPGGYQWWLTCGAPVCPDTDSDDPNIPNCTSEQEQDPCSTPGATCEPAGNNCEALLLCANEDPKDETCPISRARHKDAISYLDDSELQRVRDEFLGMRMARWHYTSEPVASRQHLGFIIDDQPNSPAVMSNGERVDLYGYTSMAAATIQVQQKQIDALEREVEALRQAVLGARSK
jgi:hypothetical protein